MLAGYVGVAAFVAIEGAVREPGDASSLDASAEDQGTTRMIVAAYVLAAVLPAVLRRMSRRRLPRVAGPVGVALEAGGLGMRTWSMQTLGSSYSRTLHTTAHQPIVDRGPYRFIRHPGYLGSLMTWLGFALTSSRTPVVVTVTGLLAGAYWRRISAEEELLRHELPGYSDYASRTKKLVPLVW